MALAALSGVLWYFAFPPQPFFWLAWIAPAPAIVAQYRLVSSDKAARVLQAFAVCLPLGGLFWQAFPFGMTPHYWGNPGPLVIAGSPAPAIVFLGVPLFGLFLYLTGLPAGWPAFHKRTRFRFFVVTAMAGWTTLDFLRLRLELGHFWGGLYTTHGMTPILLSLASVGGPWLVSAVIAGGGALMALLALTLWPPPADLRKGVPASRRGWRTLFRQATLFVVAAAALMGAVRLGQGFSQPVAGAGRSLAAEVPSLRVAAVQPGRDMDDYQRLAGTGDYVPVALTVLPDLERLTRQAAAQGARLIVWPEAAFWVDPRTDSQITPRLVALAREVHAYVLVTWFLDAPQDRQDRNESTLLSPDGTFASNLYAKQHPIGIIGESSATKGPLPVFILPAGVTRGQSGAATRAPVGIMMGYDLAFPDTARKLAERGARVLAVGTHDWTQMSPIFGKLAELRAAENDVALVKADWRVGSTIVDADGHLLAQAPVDRYQKLVLVADLPLVLTDSTFYTRAGDLAAWLAVVCYAALLLWSFGESFRRFIANGRQETAQRIRPRFRTR